MTRDEIKRVIGYVRVSTVDQADSGAGSEAQRAAIEAKAVQRGWELLEVRSDVASGKSMNGRHELKRTLADLKAGKADALVAAKLDRLSRSVADFASLLEAARREGWHLVMLDLELDTSTPMGEAMANMAMTFAQFERRMISLRTREALAVVKARGPREGKKPIGRAKSISPGLERRIVRMRRRGLAFEAIADKLSADGIPTPSGGQGWSWRTVATVARRHLAEPVKTRNKRST